MGLPFSLRPVLGAGAREVEGDPSTYGLHLNLFGDPSPTSIPRRLWTRTLPLLACLLACLFGWLLGLKLAVWLVSPRCIFLLYKTQMGFSNEFRAN